MFQRPTPYYEVHHGGGGDPWFGTLLLVVLLGALVLVAFTLWRTYHQPQVVAAAPSPAPAPPDPALAELRLRYARGDIARDEYLQRATDLGDVVAAAPATAPPPPPESPSGAA